MYSHADRFPTGEPLPQRQLTARPWGVARMAPYPPFETPTYTAIEIDPRTQVGRYLDADGTPVDLSPKHGTLSGTNPPTGTTGSGDRNSDAPDTDYGNDTDQ
ncbi:MAG TPA: putative ATP-grasp-modified RiPP [Jiangellaceae bacterium]